MRTRRGLACWCAAASFFLCASIAAQTPTGVTPKPASPVAEARVDPRTDTGLVPRPAVQSGDEWIYRRGTGREGHVVHQSISAINEKGISLKTEVPGSGESAVTVYDREWRLLGSGFNDYSPALAYYAFPLYPGKRWGIDSQVSNFGAGQSGRMQGEGRAIRWEEVQVPAGRFLTLKIEISIDAADPGDPARVFTVRETHWYSRLVLRPVKVISETVATGAAGRSEIVELVSYRVE